MQPEVISDFLPREKKILCIQPRHHPSLYLGNQVGLLVVSDKNFAACLGCVGVIHFAY